MLESETHPEKGLKISNSKSPKSGLKAKLIRVFILVGAIPLLFAVVSSYIQGNQSLIQVIGASFQALAYETSTKVDLLINQERKKIKHFAGHPTLILAVREQNRVLQNMPPGSRVILLKEQEELWRESAGNHPDSIIKRGANRVLQSFIKNDSQSGMATRRLFVTDLQGSLVASINPTPAYINRNLSSWHAIIEENRDLYIGELFPDPGTEDHLFELATPLLDQEKATIGVLHRFFSAKDFFSSSIEPIVFGETGHVMLIDSRGRVLDCPILPTGHQLSNPQLVVGVTGPAPNWVQTQGDGHGSKDLSIIGFSPLQATNPTLHASTGQRWFTFAWQASEEVFAPTRKLFWWAALAGLFSLALIATLGSLAANQIVRPIKQLKNTAELIGQGKAVSPLKITTGDEIEILAEEINTMNAMLRKAFSGLEQEVEEKNQEVIYLKKYTDNILMSVPEAILIFNPELKIEYANSAFKKFTQGKNEDYLGKSLAEIQLNFKDQWDFLNQELVQFRQDGPLPHASRNPTPTRGYEIADPLAQGSHQPSTLESQNSLTFGEQIFTYQFFEVYIEEQKRHRIGLILKDVTEEKKLLDQLARADKLSGLGTLTAGIAHEINNPLYAVIGYAEALTNEKDMKKIQSYSQKVLDRAKHMSSIILNMAGYTRSSALDTLKEVNVNDRIDAATEIALLATYSDDIVLEKNYQELPPVKAKPEEIQQVFVNIIRNAVQAMKGKGKIIITSQTVNDNVHVTIQDNGPGIPREYLSKVFDPFFTTKDQGEGTGLGLNIVHRMVEKYGGKIQIESEPGAGATFSISLPAAD